VRIVQLEAPTAGKDEDHLYRTVQPCRALAALPGIEVVSGSFLVPALHPQLATADVLVLRQVVEPDLLPIIEARRQSGRLTVYELHDHVLAPQAYTGAAALAKNPLARSLSCQLGARAHAVQFSGAALERAFAHLQPPTRRAVFPDQLWDLPAARARDHDHDQRVWLGWSGALANLEDLKWVMPALRAAMSRHPRLGLSISAPESLLGALTPLFAGLPRARVRHTAASQSEQFLAGLDLGLCPLLPSDFNRCRSDARLLELAARAVPALCSDVGPYRAAITSGSNGFLFRGLEELGAQLDRLLTDGELRARLGREARATLAVGRRQGDHAPAQLAQYRRWQQLAREEAELPSAASGPVRGGYFNHDTGAIDETDRSLRAGLALAGVGRISEALEAFTEAAALAPAFYLPRLYHGTLEPDLGRALASLDAAQVLAPRSPNVALQRGLRLEAAGHTDEAVRAYRTCRTLAPTLGAAEVQLGALCEAAGDLAQAARHYEQAYAANPYFTPAVVRLAHRALVERNPGRATRLLESALAHDPKMWRFHFLLGRAFCDVGRWQAAHHHLESALGDADEPAPVLALLARTQIALGDVSAAQATVSELRRLGSSSATV
jgi:tetratricopeptide (TPR) repeat protein